MSEQKHELYQRHWNEVTKYMYYVIGLSVASVAFAVHSSMDLSISYKAVPLGLAILLWGISVACGLGYLTKIRFLLKKNIGVLEYKDLQHQFRQSRQREIDILNAEIETIEDKANWLYRFCLWALALGACSFITWRIIEMLPSGPTGI